MFGHVLSSVRQQRLGLFCHWGGSADLQIRTRELCFYLRRFIRYSPVKVYTLSLNSRHSVVCKNTLRWINSLTLLSLSFFAPSLIHNLLRSSCRNFNWGWELNFEFRSDSFVLNHSNVDLLHLPLEYSGIQYTSVTTQCPSLWLQNNLRSHEIPVQLHKHIHSYVRAIIYSVVRNKSCHSLTILRKLILIIYYQILGRNKSEQPVIVSRANRNSLNYSAG